MSTVIAIIHQNQLCLASDTKVSQRDDDSYKETTIKQIEINHTLAIGFTGTHIIAEAMLKSIENWKIESCEEKINSARVDGLPEDLTFFFEDFISKCKPPNYITPQLSALIVGLDKANQPTIARWSSSYPCSIAHQSSPNNFTAAVLPPSGMTESECLGIAWNIADSPEFDGSLKNLSANYIRIVASRNKFVNDHGTFWVVDMPKL